MLSKTKALENLAKAWEETARMYAQNADYWRERYEKSKKGAK